MLVEQTAISMYFSLNRKQKKHCVYRKKRKKSRKKKLSYETTAKRMRKKNEKERRFCGRLSRQIYIYIPREETYEIVANMKRKREREKERDEQIICFSLAFYLVFVVPNKVA